jgi:hypothetical protein
MKRFLCCLFVLVLLSCSVSLAVADKHLYNHYALLIDGNFYNEFFGAHFDYDTILLDIYLCDNFRDGYMYKEMWSGGEKTSPGFSAFYYSSTGKDFTLTFKDGSSISGYWDDNDDDIWISSGDVYFRLCPVHYFDMNKDMVTK